MVDVDCLNVERYVASISENRTAFVGAVAAVSADCYVIELQRACAFGEDCATKIIRRIVDKRTASITGACFDVEVPRVQGAAAGCAAVMATCHIVAGKCCFVKIKFYIPFVQLAVVKADCSALPIGGVVFENATVEIGVDVHFFRQAARTVIAHVKRSSLIGGVVVAIHALVKRLSDSPTLNPVASGIPPNLDCAASVSLVVVKLRLSSGNHEVTFKA